MGAYLAKAIAMGPLVGSAPVHQDLRAADNMAKFADTNTGVVRIWADWPTIEPKCEDSLPPDPNRNQFWKALDENIKLAKSQGLIVMLTAYRYATWGNDVTWTEGKWDDKRYQQTIPDRVPSSFKQDLDFRDPGWVNRLRELTNNFQSNYKPLDYKIPDRLGPTSDWGVFITKLLSRYSRFGPANPDPQNMYIDFFQPINEPNWQPWPQQAESLNPSDPWERSWISIHCSVLQMLQTAKHIRDGFHPATPILLAPDTAGTLNYGRLRTPCLNIPTGRNNGFTELLLGMMKAVQFDTQAFAWSHHNYGDIEDEADLRLSQDPDNSSGKVHLAARVREVLQQAGWTGFGHNEAPVGPKLFLTEGGCRLDQVAGSRAEQAARLQRAYDRIRNTSLGDGILMLTQYLLHSDVNFDCGLCEVDPAAGCRPSYTMWKGLPRT